MIGAARLRVVSGRAAEYVDAPHDDLVRAASAQGLESAHRDHYKSGAHKHRSRDEHRCFKWGHDPVVTHGTTLTRWMALLTVE